MNYLLTFDSLENYSLPIWMSEHTNDYKIS